MREEVIDLINANQETLDLLRERLEMFGEKIWCYSSCLNVNASGHYLNSSLGCGASDNEWSGTIRSPTINIHDFLKKYSLVEKFPTKYQKNIIFTEPKWLIDITSKAVKEYSELKRGEEFYNLMKMAHDQGIDVKWKFEINRNLHENIALGLAIGRLLLEDNSVYPDDIGQLEAVTWFEDADELCFITEYDSSERHFTLPDSYEIPEKVLKWAEEYENLLVKKD